MAPQAWNTPDFGRLIAKFPGRILGLRVSLRAVAPLPPSRLDLPPSSLDLAAEVKSIVLEQT